MSALVPCNACHRHVRASETSCPFCRAALVIDPSARPGDPTTRLGRAAIFAFRASAALALSTASACGGGGGQVYGGPPTSIAPPTSIIMQPYGAPPNPPPTEPPPPPTTGDPSVGSEGPLYGGPVLPETEQTLEDVPEAPPVRPQHPRHGIGSLHALEGGTIPAYGAAPPPPPRTGVE